jgi:superfamily II DNA or RNA helicase
MDVCFTLTTDEGVRKGIISPYIEFNIPVTLNEEEKSAYARVQMAYFNLERQLGGFKAFDNASYLMKTIGAIAVKDRDYQTAIQFYKTMHKRKTLLYNVASKEDAVKELIDKLKIEKSVIFSQSTLFADKVCFGRNDIIPYHSKVKDRVKVMKRFNDKRTKINHLSTCMAVNEGMDLPKLPVIIIAARTVSYVFNLYLKDTQDEKWLMKSQSTTDPDNIIFVNSVDEVLEKVNNLNKELTSLDVE